MSYTRVIPRDLFNEASLLQCHGQLYIVLERTVGNTAQFSEEDMPYFDVQQREADGAIYIADLTLDVGGVSYCLWRPLNSRKKWPLYAEDTDGGGDVIPVFDASGELTPDMLALVRQQPNQEA